MRLLLGMAAVTVFAGTSFATVIAGPSAGGSAGGFSLVATGVGTNTLTFNQNDNTWSSNDGIIGDSISVNGMATFVEDPSISYGLSFNNNTNATELFDVILSTPFSGGPYNLADSTESSTYTATSGAPGAITPEVSSIVNPTATGAGSFGDISIGCTTQPVGSFNCDAINDLNIVLLPPTTAAGVLEVEIQAEVGAYTNYGITGSALLTANNNFSTPEPSTWSMLVGGLLVAAGSRFKRHAK